MRGMLSLLYGVAAYVACLAAQMYLIGFSGNLLVPKSVDVGATAPFVEALGTDLLLVDVFQQVGDELRKRQLGGRSGPGRRGGHRFRGDR